MRLIDISQPLRVGMPVWPGDEPLRLRWTGRLADGFSVNLGAVTMSLHTGTHTDASLHVSEDGMAIHEVPLDAYVGPCRVIERLGDEPLGPELLDEVDIEETPRLLFKTRRGGPPETWTDDFAFFDPALVERFGKAGGRLLGIDTPSMDSSSSKSLDSHHMMMRYGIMNLENLNIEKAEPGRYELLALPLLLAGMDASPIRAVLRMI